MKDVGTETNQLQNSINRNQRAVNKLPKQEAKQIELKHQLNSEPIDESTDTLQIHLLHRDDLRLSQLNLRKSTDIDSRDLKRHETDNCTAINYFQCHKLPSSLREVYSVNLYTKTQ